MKKLSKRKSSLLLGSTRGRFFKEKNPENRLSFSAKRSQRIRVRHRYVAMALKDAGLRFWMFLKAILIIGGVIWVSIFLVHFWHTNPLLKVREIRFYGDIPEKLPATLSLRPGQNIVLMNTFREERNALREFPELKSISVWRTPMRDVVVRGNFREAVALCEREGLKSGIDISGFIFPITGENEPREQVPFVEGIRMGELAGVMKALVTLKKATPDFYSLISRLETDTINNINVELRGQITIFWGQLNQKDLVEKAERVQEVLKRFVPKRKPAVLRFVTANRLVIDSNWIEKEEQKI